MCVYIWLWLQADSCWNVVGIVTLCVEVHSGKEETALRCVLMTCSNVPPSSGSHGDPQLHGGRADVPLQSHCRCAPFREHRGEAATKRGVGHHSNS